MQNENNQKQYLVSFTGKKFGVQAALAEIQAKVQQKDGSRCQLAEPEHNMDDIDIIGCSLVCNLSMTSHKQ